MSSDDQQSDETAVDVALRSADVPRRPSPEFEANLRESLLDDDPAVQIRPSRRPKQWPVWVAGAAAAAALVAFVAFGVLRPGDEGNLTTGDENPTGTTAPTPTGPDLDAAETACSTFEADAFQPLTRQQVVGPQNTTVLTTRDEVAGAADRLAVAADEFGTQLALAGINDPAITAEIGRVQTRAETAAQWARDERRALTTANDELRKLSTLLIRIDRLIIEQGVTRCG